MNCKYFFSVLFICSIVTLKIFPYSIEGHITGLKEGEKVIMQLIFSDVKIPPVSKDSGFVNNGSFRINGHVPEGPRYYWLFFADRKPVQKFARLFIDDDEQVIIHCMNDINKIQDQEITHYLAVYGSTSNTAFSTLSNLDKLTRQKYGRSPSAF